MGFHNCKGEVRKGTIEKENLVIFNLSTIIATVAANSSSDIIRLALHGVFIAIDFCCCCQCHGV